MNNSMSHNAKIEKPFDVHSSCLLTEIGEAQFENVLPQLTKSNDQNDNQNSITLETKKTMSIVSVHWFRTNNNSSVKLRLKDTNYLPHYLPKKKELSKEEEEIAIKKCYVVDPALLDKALVEMKASRPNTSMPSSQKRSMILSKYER